MEVLYESCCGLDIHARTVVACLIRKRRKAIRSFGTMSEDLLALRDWLVGEQNGVIIPNLTPGRQNAYPPDARLAALYFACSSLFS